MQDSATMLNLRGLEDLCTQVRVQSLCSVGTSSSNGKILICADEMKLLVCKNDGDNRR